jgi:hypothetical protein
MITAEQIHEAVAHAAEAAWSKDATWKEVVAAAINAWAGIELRTFIDPVEKHCGMNYAALPIPPEPVSQKPRRHLDEMRGMFTEAYKNNRRPRDE